MGPVIAIGLYEISRRREQGQAVSWLDAFAVLRSPAILSIAHAGPDAAGHLPGLAGGRAARSTPARSARVPHATLGALLHDVLDTPAGWRMLLIGNLVGGGFAVLVLVLTVVSFPMILDRQVGPGLAIRTSIRAVMLNPSWRWRCGGSWWSPAGLVVGTSRSSSASRSSAGARPCDLAPVPQGGVA